MRYHLVYSLRKWARKITVMGDKALGKMIPMGRAGEAKILVSACLFFSSAGERLQRGPILLSMVVADCKHR